jgi:hypothetical protein
MSLDRQRCRPLLQSFNFRHLFIEELGWDAHKATLDLALKEGFTRLESVAHKRGFVAWHCPAPDGHFPDASARRKIEREVAKASHEHLIVFTDAARTRQIWQWVRRDPGQPLRLREIEWGKTQSGELILQKLDPLFISLDEEETLTLVEVASRARANVSERVTKKFYEEFRKQHAAFLKFITGIPNQGDHEWYASVMLNRLMFVYFVQKKGFLDGDTDYLRNRLNQLKGANKGDKFYSFYRAFLLRLFHEGLGGKEHKGDLARLIGRVPYLNGGIFDVHQLERDYGEKIHIPDSAFEAVFDYFDRYQWHLDERPLRSDNEINPDVLGYIFEKYINQKQMGAYYTKEDITEYISKSTIIPFLFDSARTKCKVAFENPNGPTVWDLLRENPDRYIYPAVRHGCDLPLPADIAAGLDTQKPGLIERRKGWNQSAPPEYALPTEIWREVVARRQRYWEVWSRLSGRQANPIWVATPPTKDELNTSAFCISPSAFEINDFITLNLDLRQFAQDVIQNSEGPDLLMALWQTLSSMTILDPTGGSGAFVFAALSILEPLYEGCLDRMEGFLTEWEGADGSQPSNAAKPRHPNYTKKFSEILAHVAAHPNRRYFVLKSIILNNLYAVDIMEEAVEICKLRLFLKLAAQVEADDSKPNFGIEPLPDIDFNIRCGNTLVGYATYEEVQRAVTSTLDFDNAMEKIATKAADLQQTFDTFRQLQTQGDGTVPVAHKRELQKRLKALEDELNRHLAGEYGVKVSDKATYNEWLQSHQPFHWFIQFYGIISNGGFDVIIGNPPFVENTSSNVNYQISHETYTTLNCGNLYAFVTERSAILLSKFGSFSFIMPAASICTPRMSPLDTKLRCRFGKIWTSVWDERPSKLFDGVDQQLAIQVGRGIGPAKHIAGSPMRHWAAEERDILFATLAYVDLSATQRVAEVLPKIGSSVEHKILTKMFSIPAVPAATLMTGSTKIFYRNAGGRYWRLVKTFPSYFRSGTGATATSTEKTFSVSKDNALVLVALFSSSFFYWYWRVCSNCRHLTDRELGTFPIAQIIFELAASQGIKKHAIRFEERLKETKQRQKTENRRSGTVVQDIFRVSSAKPIIDEIDTILAEYYGFTEEELDFIINYDIKYRMGRGAGDEEDA